MRQSKQQPVVDLDTQLYLKKTRRFQLLRYLTILLALFPLSVIFAHQISTSLSSRAVRQKVALLWLRSYPRSPACPPPISDPQDLTHFQDLSPPPPFWSPCFLRPLLPARTLLFQSSAFRDPKGLSSLNLSSLCAEGQSVVSLQIRDSGLCFPINWRIWDVPLV